MRERVTVRPSLTCVCVYVLAEMWIKMLAARGLRGYFSVRMNRFDFFVVLTSAPSVFMPCYTGTLLNDTSFSAVTSFRVFRLFRVFRMIRLLHKVRSMRALMAVLLKSIAPLLNLVCFLMVTLVTCAILATNLFSRPQMAHSKDTNPIDSNGYNKYSSGQQPRFTYDSFFNSFLSLFMVMTGVCVFVCMCALV